MEVKWSTGDLLSSLQTIGEAGGPRLAVEVKKMASVADIPILIIPQLRQRGDGKVLRDDGQPSGWQYNAVKGILTDVQLLGVMVDEWADDIDVRIAQLFYVISHEEHGWIRQRGRSEFVSLDPVYSEAVWALASVEGWGPVTAEAALEEMDCLANVIHVAAERPKELLAIKGVGPKLADRLHEVVTRGR